LLCTPRLYLEQLPALWRFGPVMIADHTRDDSIERIARRVLSQAPVRFALIGLSMGGYVSFELLRQAPERVVKLALLDTTARPDAPEQSAQRKHQIELTRTGRFAEAAGMLFPKFVAASRRTDEPLRALVLGMAEETGPEAFIRQQTAIMGRPDSRPGLAAIGCPTLVLVGERDELTPPERAEEIAAAVPDARLALVPEAGHLSTIERPEAVTAALVDFLT
jgi:pimeloyl-ACP methyl ester carboxylesterase